jgi:hypothetical protein
MSINLFLNMGSFIVLTVLWLGFAAALLFNPALLDAAWQMFRGLPIVAQLGIGLLLLPLVLGLWLWQTPWPLWIRLVLVVGLAWVTIYTFLPKQT